LFSKIPRETLETLFKRIVNRELFTYSYKEPLEYVMRCICWRSNKSLAKDKRLSKHLYHTKGSEKLTRDLDVTKLLKRN